MKLSDHLSESLVIAEMQSSTKDEAIRELARLLDGNDRVLDFDRYVKDVFDREKEGSTGIGRGAAIPHARTDALRNFVVAVGRSKKGVDFDAIDGKPVKVVILMGTPKEKVRSYLVFLAHVSHLIKKQGFLESILAAADAKTIVELFREQEN
ncbi:MAG: PTS sugar transporter subunit IIA [Planctomycetes bacterium]|nr:PTS sugar transporter subunit IIA [Planctomycetota bacterium]